MNEDELLRELVQHAREDGAASGDVRWERLAAGELSAAEEATLRDEAAKDPELAALYEACRPLGDAAREKIVARILPSPAAPRVGRFAAGRRIALVAASVAVAAAVAVWMTSRGPEPVARLDMAPPYVLEATGGDRPRRSAPEPSVGAMELTADSRLALVLRPSSPAPDAVSVRAFLVRGGDARAWNPPMQRSPDGAVRIAGAAGELLGSTEAGTWTLAFAIGRAEQLPSDPQEVVRAIDTDAGARAWQLLVTRVTLTGGR
jgi:hypothetical protein